MTLRFLTSDTPRRFPTLFGGWPKPRSMAKLLGLFWSFRGTPGLRGSWARVTMGCRSENGGSDLSIGPARILGGGAAMTIVVSAVLVSGCSSESPSNGIRGLEAAAKSGRVLADMGQPAVALVVSGQLDGYFEPCGGALGQTGGLIRRYELIERLRRQDWPVLQIDLGGLIHRPDEGRGRPEHVTMKLQHAPRRLPC